MSAYSEDSLARIETLLKAILGIQIDQYLRDTGIAKPRPRSIDKMLADSGLNNVEIARLLGKSHQAVSQVLAKEKSGRNGLTERGVSKDGLGQDTQTIEFVGEAN